jgi:hypothetical protein
LGRNLPECGQLLLREQNHIGSVDALKLNEVVVERLKNIGDSRGGGALGRLIEGRPKAIGAGAGSPLHGEKCSLDFILRERPIESVKAQDLG